METSLTELSRLRKRKTLRESSWDRSGRNTDAWTLEPGETRTLADLEGPGCIRHIWMTQRSHYRECLLRITWDDAPGASVLCPLGDFFGLGHGLVNSYQSCLFSASTKANNQFNQGCALNAYVPMPFRKRAKVDLLNESNEVHRQFFYIDYEKLNTEELEGEGYFHAEFRRQNPFGGWGHEIRVNTPEANIASLGRLAWDNNYVILETNGRGHYVGCNLSVTNFQGTWWGEGDDMIWVDGYKWPPDLHGTGSEDYLNQAWGMQPNAYLRNGSSLFENATGGYQTSYVQHVDNPIYFEREIKVTIEHVHGNHLRNEMSSVAYWYASEPATAALVSPMPQRLPVLRDNMGNWIRDAAREHTSREVPLNTEMQEMKVQWKKRQT